MTDRPSRTIAIVDAYSTGTRLAGMFAEHGWRSLHVQTAPEVPSPYRAGFRPQDFMENLIFDGDLAGLGSVLRKHGVDLVVAGAETGVILQDKLNAQLNLPGNPLATSTARRDKYDMQERLKAKGLAHIPQIKSTDAQDLIDFAETRAGWPMVVKPVNSAGGDGVSFCNGPEDVRSAVARMLGAQNIMGLRNGELVGQKMLKGDEHVVNAVLRDGQCFISEIWRIHKSVIAGGHIIYDYGELLDAEGPIQAALSAYMLAVVAALDFKQGAAHAEIMLTADGPVLIEIGARLAGAVSHATTHGALGYSHPSLLVESLCCPDVFQARLGKPYAKRAHANFVSLISHQDGVISDTPGYQQAARLPSFVEAINPRKAGDAITPTIDLFTSPGLIYLRHPDAGQIDTDRAAIRSMERNGFFTLVQS